MREIKFRGQRIDNGEWTTGDLIQLLGEQGKGRKFVVDNKFGACIDNLGNFINTEAPFVNEIHPETVGQYTGLQDRNGNDIYEGDIVYFCDKTIPRWIKFHNGAFTLYEGESRRLTLGEIWPNKDLEVIGSIHSNPELLEATV